MWGSYDGKERKGPGNSSNPPKSTVSWENPEFNFLIPMNVCECVRLCLYVQFCEIISQRLHFLRIIMEVVVQFPWCWNLGTRGFQKGTIKWGEESVRCKLYFMFFLNKGMACRNMRAVPTTAWVTAHRETTRPITPRSFSYSSYLQVLVLDSP